MKLPLLLASVLVGVVAVTSTGCAVFTKGRKQMVVVRSTPDEATTKINGYEVGVTPFKVQLPRADVYRVDLEKSGYGTQSALFLPSSVEYDERFLRWGIDYDFGAATDLIPGELVVELKPVLANVQGVDRFAEMSAQIVRADEMLAKGELTPADHKFLVEQILATYRPTR